MPRLGLVTIGQSPRADVTSDLIKILPREIEIIEAGALDDLSLEEIKSRLAPGPGETLYVTRLRNGVEVKISREKILDLMQKKIDLLNEKKVDLIGVLCSGEFPEFRSQAPIIYPDKVLKGLVSSISYSGRSAVLLPAPEQITYGKEKWSRYLKEPIVLSISPYTSRPEDFIKVGEELRRSGVELVVMDCIGYSLEQRNMIKKVIPSAKIITSRGALAHAITVFLT